MIDHYCKQDIRKACSRISRPLEATKLIALLNHTSRCQLLAVKQRQLRNIAKDEATRAKTYLTAAYRYGQIALASSIVSLLLPMPLLAVTLCLHLGHAALLTIRLGFWSRRTNIWNSVTTWQGRHLDTRSDSTAVFVAAEFVNLSALTATGVVLPIWQWLDP